MGSSITGKIRADVKCTRTSKSDTFTAGGSLPASLSSAYKIVTNFQTTYTNFNLLQNFPHNPPAKFSKSPSHLTRISSAFQAPSNCSFKASPPAGEPKRTPTHRYLKLQIGNESSSSNGTQHPNPPIIRLQIQLQCRAHLSVVPTTWHTVLKQIYIFYNRRGVSGGVPGWPAPLLTRTTCIKSTYFTGLFTLWTMKSSQGLVKSLIGCWTRPPTTSFLSQRKKCQSYEVLYW